MWFTYVKMGLKNVEWNEINLWCAWILLIDCPNEFRFFKRGVRCWNRWILCILKFIEICNRDKCHWRWNCFEFHHDWIQIDMKFVLNVVDLNVIFVYVRTIDELNHENNYVPKLKNAVYVFLFYFLVFEKNLFWSSFWFWVKFG